MRTLAKVCVSSLVLCAISLLTSASAAVDLAPTVEGKSSLRSASDWTILLYVAADNSAEPRADFSLFQIRQATSGLSDHPAIVATVDRQSTEGTTTLEFAEGAVRETGTAEQDFSDPAVLRAFVEFGMRKYPADRTMLVVIGEGWGWRGVCRVHILERILPGRDQQG